LFRIGSTITPSFHLYFYSLN